VASIEEVNDSTERSGSDPGMLPQFLALQLLA
jgi:hypothetical protein